MAFASHAPWNPTKQDCKRAFPRVLVLGGALAAVSGRLREGRAGCTHATFADSSPAQLELARAALCPDRGPQDTQFTRLASDEVLPFPVSSFDLVVCCLGIHWRNDLPGVLVQARRTLRPDGLFLGALLGGSTLSELRIACSLAEQEREGGLSARCSPLAQVRDAGSLLGRAGLSLPAVDVDTLTVRYPTPLDAVTHLRVLAEGNAVTARRKSLRRDTALASAALYSTLFAEKGAEQPQGVPSTFQVVYMTGWAPHENQPAAKRRGSATVSFADLANALP